MSHRAKSIQPRRSHRPRRSERVTVADVVRMAAVQAPAPRPRAVDPDDELTTVVISTGPRIRHAIPAPPADFVPYPLATAAPLAPGHAHADVVLAELVAAAAEVEHPAPPVAEHVVHHQLSKTWLRVVPLVDPDATLCDDVELLIARFACAVSDLAVRPGGVHALTMLCAPYSGAPLSTWDHRRLDVPVGFDLETAVAA